MKLGGKVAIITGGSKGIGLAIAKSFLREGAKVVISSRREENLKRAEEEVEKEIGKKLICIQAHNGKVEDLEKLVKTTIEKLGKINILVNNASTNPITAPLHEYPIEAWEKIIQVNLTGTFMLSQLVAKEMIKSGIKGSIINISSVAGLMASPLIGVYAITKAGIISMTRTMAVELAPYGIMVNTIAPGIIKTKFAEFLWKNFEDKSLPIRRIPMGRFGQPEEIVGAALLLASDDSSFMTGSIIVVDGGTTA